ncbi:6254_t:CDS:2, partial [Gigaspora rosea]
QEACEKFKKILDSIEILENELKNQHKDNRSKRVSNLASENKNKLTQIATDNDEKVEILETKEKYFKDELKKALDRKPNLGSIKEINYMSQVLILEKQICELKNYDKLQNNLINLIQENKDLLTKNFNLRKQLILGRVKNNDTLLKIEKDLENRNDANKQLEKQIYGYIENLKKNSGIASYTENQKNIQKTGQNKEFLANERSNEKMKEMLNHFKIKNIELEKIHKNARIWRESVFAVKSRKELIQIVATCNEKLEILEAKIDYITTELEQALIDTDYSCLLKEINFESQISKLKSQIKILKNDDYKKLKIILSDLSKENSKLVIENFEKNQKINDLRNRIKFSNTSSDQKIKSLDEHTMTTSITSNSNSPKYTKNNQHKMVTTTKNSSITFNSNSSFNVNITCYNKFLSYHNLPMLDTSQPQTLHTFIFHLKKHNFLRLPSFSIDFKKSEIHVINNNDTILPPQHQGLSPANHDTFSRLNMCTIKHKY